ncbi:hypothetical protein [Flammeovirga aprica]|uniref:Uncharacterized protein n=1 Tax=Flammeovirga aprica JL-4 TaxID=694437 RepID=A0A7X9XDH4_9BACT|nr:hypothetical protein [Flammeovirga aprica]NME72852.1 hypothetical protein [Flammeovirga aprica JL-4]
MLSFASTKNAVLTRVNSTPKFSFKHTDEELYTIILRAKSLKLPQDELEDLLFISCREAKVIEADELIKQIDNWINVVKKEGLPYKFTGEEQFLKFKNELKQGLQNIGVSVSDVRIQGSSLRTPNANDVDLVAMVSQNDFEHYLKGSFIKLTNKKTGDIFNLTEMSNEELFTLATYVRNNPSYFNSKAMTFQNAFFTKKISSKTTKPAIIPGLRNLRKALFENYKNLNIEDISIMTPKGGLDLKPYINL